MIGAVTAAATLGLTGNAAARPDLASIVPGVAPGGTLRAAINYGNAVLAARDASGTLSGVSVDIARELARRLKLPLALVPFDAAGKVSAAAANDVWDVAFLARDPQRAESIAFTAAYVVIDGNYVVRRDSPIATIEQVDRDGISVAVAARSAYDLHLTRALEHATLVRAGNTPETIALFRAKRLDVLAGVKAALDRVVADDPSLRMIAPPFMAIEQAMGMPSGRPPSAVAYLAAFVESIKVSGFVANALATHGQGEATVAPPAEARS
jgi:polar amino acid transport system substrate-binding protein